MWLWQLITALAQLAAFILTGYRDAKLRRAGAKEVEREIEQANAQARQKAAEVDARAVPRDKRDILGRM